MPVTQTPTRGALDASRSSEEKLVVSFYLAHPEVSWLDVARKMNRKNLTMYRVRQILLRNKVMRRQGTPRVSEEEVARRQAIAAKVTSWVEYGRRIGVKNPRLDRRLGIRLLCWSCRKRLSTRSIGDDKEGGKRPVCGVCARKLVKARQSIS